MKVMKDSIIERLLKNNHITILMADSLLNNRDEKTSIIKTILESGYINFSEAVTLLKDVETISIPFGTPNQINPTNPWIQPYTDWTYDPNRPGQPRWEVTCSNDLNKNFTDK